MEKGDARNANNYASKLQAHIKELQALATEEAQALQGIYYTYIIHIDLILIHKNFYYNKYFFFYNNYYNI